MGPVCTFGNKLKVVGNLSGLPFIIASLLLITCQIIRQSTLSSQSEIFYFKLVLFLIYCLAGYLNRSIYCVFVLKLFSQWNMATERKSALKVLEETSRTFFIPIVKLPPQVQEAVASAYLCLRAIDEVQDHPHLSNPIKSQILKNISIALQKFSPSTTVESLVINWGPERQKLPQVSLRLAEWIFYCPESFRGRVADVTATMSDRMGYWAERNWRIDSEEDLDVYTFAVAGAVGLILCQIWEWFEGTKTERNLAIGYGRGLQSVNILRNSGQDKERGVTFYPPGWTQQDMIDYSKRNLKYAEQYMTALPQGSAARTFCEIPLGLAIATVNIIGMGGKKLSRQQVMEICKVKV